MRSSALLSVVVALGCSVQAYIIGEEHVDSFDSLPLSGYSAGLLVTDGFDDGPESGGLEYSALGTSFGREYFYYQNHGITRYSVVAGGIIPHSTPIAAFLEQPRNGRISAVRNLPNFTTECTELKSTYVACSLFTRNIYYGLNLKIPNMPIGCRVTFKGYDKAGKSVGVKNYDFMPDLIRPPNKAYEALAAGNIFGFIENTPFTSDMKLMQLDLPPGTKWDVSANALPLPAALPAGLPPNVTTILRDTVYDIYSEIIVLHLDDVTYTVVGGEC